MLFFYFYHIVVTPSLELVIFIKHIAQIEENKKRKKKIADWAHNNYLSSALASIFYARTHL